MGYHTVVVADILTVKRMVLAYTVVYCIIATRINVVKVAVTLTDNCFPNESLCCHNVCKFVCVACILSAPLATYTTRITILKNSTNKQFDFIGRNCFIIG